ncbi:hypothetical protein VSDG_08437 [Cytospora chrysosperma]|uniref:Uncharacterized protein n=1 Tax=Cytospora chrysosperma TaxID=252740 RepID=A0A423VHH0_CYTCH|nr:hypothetical protein VSDG_08437 [Valsa sordida]
MAKTVAIALNPSDYKMGAAIPTPGALIGMHFSGMVASIHPSTKTDLRIGDPMCGMVAGSNPAFWDPSALALTTTPESPAEKPCPMLVYGGSTATGKLESWKAGKLESWKAGHPASTALWAGTYRDVQPAQLDLVRARGSSGEVDRVRPDVVEEIKKRTNGRLKHAYDCIADLASVAHCYVAIGRTGCMRKLSWATRGWVKMFRFRRVTEAQRTQKS